MYDASTRTNRITFPARSIHLVTTLTLSAAPAGFSMLRQMALNRRIKAVTGKPASSVQDALTDTTLTPAQQEALLAVAGVGLVAHNEGTYLYHGSIQNYLYDSGGTVTPITTPTMSWRGRTVPLPVSVQTSFGGREYQLPLVPQTNLILTPDNVARMAHVTANGAEDGYTAEGAVDGVAGGYPDDKANEWSAGSKAGAFLTLTWDTPQTIDHVALYDRPNTNDQVTAGVLTFSDGSTLPFGTLPDDGKTPLDVRFSPKAVTSLTFKVTAVKPSTENAGLSEIAVYKAK